jgi:hypothetical protein
MKKMYQIAWVILVALSLSSCFGSDYQASPVIYVAKAYRTAIDGAKDTIRFGDTLNIGDTVRVPMVLSGVSHPLTSFSVSADNSAFIYALRYDSTGMEAIAEDSRPEEGYLHFKDNYVVIPVSFYYVPKKSGKYTIHFSLSSLAEQKYSPREADLEQSVR